MKRSVLILVSLALASCTHGWTKPGEGQESLDRDTAYCHALLQKGQGPPRPNDLAAPTDDADRNWFDAFSLDPGMDQCLRDEGWRKSD